MKSVVKFLEKEISEIKVAIETREESEKSAVGVRAYEKLDERISLTVQLEFAKELLYIINKEADWKWAQYFIETEIIRMIQDAVVSVRLNNMKHRKKIEYVGKRRMILRLFENSTEFDEEQRKYEKLIK